MFLEDTATALCARADALQRPDTLQACLRNASRAVCDAHYAARTIGDEQTHAHHARAKRTQLAAFLALTAARDSAIALTAAADALRTAKAAQAAARDSLAAYNRLQGETAHNAPIVMQGPAAPLRQLPSF